MPRPGRQYKWRPTKRGRSCAIRAVPDPERRLGGKAFGRLVPGSTAERLLDALDRPMRGAELLERLGVTRQRVHQLIVKLHAQGRLKLDEQGKVFHIIARSDDPTILLTWEEERLLSVLPDEEPTSVTKITAATGWAAGRARSPLQEEFDRGGWRESGLGALPGYFRGGRAPSATRVPRARGATATDGQVRPCVSGLVVYC